MYLSILYKILISITFVLKFFSLTSVACYANAVAWQDVRNPSFATTLLTRTEFRFSITFLENFYKILG